MRQALTTYAIRSKPIHKDMLQIQVGRVKQELNIHDILFIKGLGDYVIIQTALKKFVTLSTMNEIMDKLPGNIFVRSHKSYIINIDQIKEMEGGKLKLNGAKDHFIIPVGRSHKKEIKIKFKEYYRV